MARFTLIPRRTPGHRVLGDLVKRADDRRYSHLNTGEKKEEVKPTESKLDRLYHFRNIAANKGLNESEDLDDLAGATPSDAPPADTPPTDAPPVDTSKLPTRAAWLTFLEGVSGAISSRIKDTVAASEEVQRLNTLLSAIKDASVIATGVTDAAIDTSVRTVFSAASDVDGDGDVVGQFKKEIRNQLLKYIA